MASLKKFTRNAVPNILRHVDRTIENPSNLDIDKKRIDQNYILSPERNISFYGYYKKRLSEVYVYNRSDVNTLAGWIVTAPADLPSSEYEVFFEASYDFLIERYGEDNCVQAIVHGDESGQPHLHFLFVPIVPDLKRGGEKVCANDLLDREEMRSFHPDFQRFLNEKGIKANVHSGVTKRQGGNRTVKEMKRSRERERVISRW